MWYSERDGHGVAYDEQGNEYYIDDSVLKFDKSRLFRSKGGVSNTGMPLTLELNTSIRSGRCGMNVNIA